MKKPTYMNFRDRINPMPAGKSICNTCKGHSYCDCESQTCRFCQDYLPNNSRQIWRNPIQEVSRLAQLKENRKITINGDPLIKKIVPFIPEKKKE